MIAEVIAETEFKGKSGKLSVTRLGSGAPIKKLLLVGLGNAEKWNSAVLRSTAAAIARAVKGDKAITTLGLQLPVAETEAITAQMVTEGMYLGFYEDNRFKSEQKDPQPSKLLKSLALATNQRRSPWAQASVKGDLCAGIG